MKTLTVQIKVINRIKIPLLPAEYKKQPKLPMRLRSSYLDHLNVYSKKIHIHEDFQAREAWSLEIMALRPLLPFKLYDDVEYGDTLIGCISDGEYGDFYTELYLSKKWMTK